MGEFGWQRSGFSNIATGAFSGVQLSTNSAPVMNNNSSSFRAITMSASQSDQTYDGTKLQAAALLTLICIKI